MTILLESGRLVSLIRVSDKGDSGERLDSVGYTVPRKFSGKKTAERFSFSTDHKGDRVAGLVQLVGHADRTLAGRAESQSGRRHQPFNLGSRIELGRQIRSAKVHESFRVKNPSRAP